jgi:uncharacterized protein YgiB involved in biofilm formation
MTRRSSSRIRVGAYASPALNGVLLATAALGLAGCEADTVPVPKEDAGYVAQLGAEDPVGQASAFKDVQECVASGDFTEQECNDAQRQSLASNGEWAPQYNSITDCQQDYDDCRPGTGYYDSSHRYHSGGGFSPFMTGFMVSRMLDSMDSRHYSPIYHTRDGSYVNGSGYGVPRMGTYPVGRSGYDGFTKPPRQVTRMGLGQTFKSKGGVPGSKTTVAKLASTTSTKALSTAAWGSTKSSSWSSATSVSSRGSGSSYGVTRGGFGSSSRGGGIGGGRSSGG